MIDKIEPSPKPRYLELLDNFGAILVTLFHKLALFVIGAGLVGGGRLPRDVRGRPCDPR